MNNVKMSRPELGRAIGIKMRSFMHWSERANSCAAKRLKLNGSDFSCLAMMETVNEPVSASHIMNYLGISSGSATALIDRLEAVGFVKRLPNPNDRRGVLIQLDKTNARVPLALHAEVSSLYRETLAKFSDEELNAIVEFLGSFNQERLDQIEELISQVELEETNGE